MAHEVVIKLKEMDLPEGLDRELASLSTDLGDLWGAQVDLADGLERFLKSPPDWGAVGAALVDLRVAIDHITWHVQSVRRPMTRITQYAYKRASGATTGPTGSP
jgi:hypothetical protein